MIYGFFILVGCQLAGEILTGTLGLAIPGAVLGMIFLFTGLIIKGHAPTNIHETANGLLKYIGLLFVPAGAGISMFFSLITEQWDVILIASVSSTVLTLITCGLLFQLLNKEQE